MVQQGNIFAGLIRVGASGWCCGSRIDVVIVGNLIIRQFHHVR